MIARLWTLVAVVILAAAHPTAQPARTDPVEAARERDTAFWRAYNGCETVAFAGFFTSDVEFYHDRGGATIGLAALDSSLAKNLCGGTSRLRREIVPDTVRWSTLRNGDTIYAAIVSGEHVFYVRPPDKPEFLDGRSRFVTLWLLKDGTWKMARLLSYDHGPTTSR
jgi:hypothetical protein